MQAWPGSRWIFALLMMVGLLGIPACGGGGVSSVPVALSPVSSSPVTTTGLVPTNGANPQSTSSSSPQPTATPGSTSTNSPDTLIPTKWVKSGRSSFPDVQLFGNASAGGDSVRLTQAAGNLIGAAYLTNPISLADDASFSVTFKFWLPLAGGVDDVDGKGTDGFTFVVAKTPELTTTGGSLGYKGILNSVAVEYDTYKNLEYEDINGDHIGIDVNGDMKSIAEYIPWARLNDNVVWRSWIDYDGPSKRLDIFLSDFDEKPGTPQLSASVDLRSIIQSDTAYLGFTAATAGGYQEHIIIDFEFIEDDCEWPDPGTTQPQSLVVEEYQNQEKFELTAEVEFGEESGNRQERIGVGLCYTEIAANHVGGGSFDYFNTLTCPPDVIPKEAKIKILSSEFIRRGAADKGKRIDLGKSSKVDEQKYLCTSNPCITPTYTYTIPTPGRPRILEFQAQSKIVGLNGRTRANAYD